MKLLLFGDARLEGNMVRYLGLTAAMLLSLLTPLPGNAGPVAPSQELSCAKKEVVRFSMSFSLDCDEKNNIKKITVSGNKKVCLYFFTEKEYVNSLHPTAYTGPNSSTSFELSPVPKVKAYDFTGDFRCGNDL